MRFEPSAAVGRPPGPHDDTLAKILPTALRLFLDEGGAALTPTRLHRETGVARATIYRNWPEPEHLLEVMLQQATGTFDGGDCRDELAHDLRAAMTSLLIRFEHGEVRPLVAACLEYGRRSERVATAAEAFISGILEPSTSRSNWRPRAAPSKVRSRISLLRWPALSSCNI